MHRHYAALRGSLLALAVSTMIASAPAWSQAAEGQAPIADTGGIDGDLAANPPPPRAPRYAPGVWEAYEQQMAAYRQKLAAAEAEHRARAEDFRKRQEAYQREMAAVQAARRRYEADRARYEAAIARRR